MDPDSGMRTMLQYVFSPNEPAPSMMNPVLVAT